MWAKFVVGSFSAPRGFPQGTPVFPSTQTLVFLKFQFDPECSKVSGSGDWATTPRVIELKQLDLI